MRSLALAFVLLSLPACGESKQQLAPTATGTSLASAAPKTAAARELLVDKNASSVSFTMDAPIEKIRGHIGGSLEGNVFLDPSDLSQTSGKITLDLDTLEIFQRKKAEGDADFGEEKKDDLQNRHAREWLQVDDAVPERERTQNRRVTFSIRSIDAVSPRDISKVEGEVRVDLEVTGELTLHTRVAKKTVALKATIVVQSGQPRTVRLKSKAPFSVALREHDVRPRDPLGKTLDQLSDKVAKDAMVGLDVTLLAVGMPPSVSAAPAESAAPPAASGSAGPAKGERKNPSFL